MSLLLVGYETKLQEDLWGNSNAKDIAINGVFVATDSGISNDTGRDCLLSSFQKVFEIEARVRYPYFIGDVFSGFEQVVQRKRFLLGFAGNTLVAQQVINVVRTHVDNLYIGPCKRNGSEEIKYGVFMPCEKTELDDPNISWDDCTFANPDAHQKALTAEKLSIIVQHCIESGLKQAARNTLQKSSAEFFIANSEYGENGHSSIYHYLPNNMSDGERQASGKLVNRDELLVLGLRSSIRDADHKSYKTLSHSDSRLEWSCSLVKKAIFERLQSGSYELNEPVFGWNMTGSKITRKKWLRPVNQA